MSDPLYGMLRIVLRIDVPPSVPKPLAAQGYRFGIFIAGGICVKQTTAERTALLALARGIAELGLPLTVKEVPANSPVVEAIRIAFSGRGMVLIHPGTDRSSVTISAYPTSVRGVSALASEVFHFGFDRISPRFRQNLAA
jgi:hypothetical protein